MVSLFMCATSSRVQAEYYTPTNAQIIYYRICSRNLRTFFSILAAEKMGCVK